MTTPTIFDQLEFLKGILDLAVDGDTLTNCSAAEPLIAIDFDEEDLTAGAAIGDRFEGVEFSSSSEFGLMLFDTNNITGEDFDLAADNLGNVLIISEDGDSEDPDDNAAGGTINIEFDRLVNVESIGFLDIDEPGSSISFYDRDAQIVQTVAIENLGDNSFQEINPGVTDVARIEIVFSSSGALTGLEYSVSKPDPFSNLYVFGDSLSDIGNIFNATTFVQEAEALPGLEIPVTPPSPPYFEGRFSSGPIWVENLAEELDITLTPSTELSFLSPDSDIPAPVTIIDGNPVVSPFFDGNAIDRSVNFAFGGAQSGVGGRGELGDFIPGVLQQVEWFVNDHQQANRAADPDALYILWVGGNDYTDPDIVSSVNPEEVIDNLETEIESLYDLGARDFFIPNLPDLGKTPLADTPDFPASPEVLTELTHAHNSLLDVTIHELENSLTGANFTLFDVNTLFDEVVMNPAEYGLTNVSDAYLDPTTLMPTMGASPDDYLFYDTLHPTELGHELVSNFALEALASKYDILL